MSRNQKILLAFGIVGLLCLIAGASTVWMVRQMGIRVRDSIKTDPTSVARVGAGIAEFDLPAGYREQMAMSLFNYDLVMILPAESSPGGMQIILMQFKGAFTASPEQMEQQIRQAAQQQSGQGAGQMTVVETREETIRGEKVVVTVSESSGPTPALRQWMTIFNGNGGPTILMIQGLAADWDDELIEDFIASIR